LEEKRLGTKKNPVHEFQPVIYDEEDSKKLEEIAMPTRLDGMCFRGLHDLRRPGAQYNDGRCRECRKAYFNARHHRLNPEAEYRGIKTDYPEFNDLQARIWEIISRYEALNLAPSAVSYLSSAIYNVVKEENE
jgi:hypothetical protein